MIRQARAVKDEAALYDDVKDWHFEYRPHQKEIETEDEYIVCLHVVSEDVLFRKESACCPLVNAEMFKDAEQDRHEWTAMLSKFAMRVETTKEPLSNFLSNNKLNPANNNRKRTIAGSAPIGPLFSTAPYHTQTFTTHEFDALGHLLDGATSLFCFDADHDFSLLKRLQTEDDFISGSGENAVLIGDTRVGRYQTCFFPEQRIYHWRLKTNDLRSEWPKHKNHDCSLRTLFYQHHIPFENALSATRRAVYETHALGRTWRDISHCEPVETEDNNNDDEVA